MGFAEPLDLGPGRGGTPLDDEVDERGLRRRSGPAFLIFDPESRSVGGSGAGPDERVEAPVVSFESGVAEGQRRRADALEERSRAIAERGAP